MSLCGRCRIGTRRTPTLVLGIALALAFPAVAADAGGVRSETVGQLVRVADISGLSASPDGEMIAFRTERASLDTNSYVLEWHVVDLRSGEIRTIGGGGDPVYADPGLVRPEEAFWSADGRFLFYRALLDGRIVLWRAAADGSGGSTVFSGDTNIEGIEAGEDGTLLLRLGATRDAVARAEEREYDDGILVDQSVDLAQPLFRGGFVDGRKASERLTGTWFRRGGLLQDQPGRTMRVDMATLAVSELAAPAGDSSAAGIAPPASALSVGSPSGAVAIAEGAGSAARLTVRDPAPAEPILCSATICRSGHIVALAWRPGADALLLTVETSTHDQSLWLWRVGARTARLLAGGTGLLSGSRHAHSPCALTARLAICVAAAPLSPPRLVSFDLDSGAMRTLYDPNPESRGLGIVDAEPLAWRAASGRQFSGILFSRRGGDRPMPLVIDYYRCEGDVRGGVGDEFPFIPLAAAGIATLCVNAPSLPGPQHAVESYKVALAGIRAVVAMLVRRRLIDSTRIGMAGLSFGSEVAMWTAARSDLLRVVSIASTQLEPTYYWFNAVRGRDQPRLLKQVWGLGDPALAPRRWRQVSALNVDRLKAPVLMQLPEQEAREVVELYARLTNSRTPAELYAFPDEDHIKILPRHKAAVYRRNLDWFRFWLQNYVDPDPAEAAQFERWRLLASRQTPHSTERSHSSDAASSMILK